MGYAGQGGLIPLPLDSIDAAIELNGVQVPFNRRAFALGRLLAHDAGAVEAMVAAARGPVTDPPATTLPELIARRVADLTAYQDAAYASKFSDFVTKVQAAGDDRLTEAVARSAYKLLAYKDEYEVGRLYSDGRFKAAFAAQFEGGEKPRVQLSPPLFARTDPATGRPRKYSFGPWVFTAFGLLARLKGLRGSAFDPFGYSAERRHERAAFGEYVAKVDRLLAGLTADNRDLAVQIAALPLAVRGFGPVKAAAATKVAAEEAALWAKWPGEALRVAA